MWTKERLLSAMADAPRLCVLLLSREADGAYLASTLTENGGAVPCRKAPDEKAALRRMAEICRRTADKNCRLTLAYTDTFTASYLAGQLGRNVSFDPLDPAAGRLALVYSGTLRSSPLI
jgi:hypothetical protein